ncbi:1-deoxy-D-xylulose-5-phosphate synthase [Streptomyces bauhiniae]|uniref:1-deoxy-D-xylulose-5-phosphate synthase n=1 Tax=Streptomyces bauhiniae TaxID=2340725 RepID=UPI003323EF57
MSDEPSRQLVRIRGPETVRLLPAARLPALAETVRSFLVNAVCETGGHLGPNLGVVELTLALHRVFRSPDDTLLFDTGHQAYVHKLLTGRAERFASLRQRDGLSGYPSRAESVHDVIENSHASTALSYADGLAKAHQLAGKRDRAVVAVIGDGACTGGMAWEALNNLGHAADRPVVVVLNDNGRSYAPTVGGWAAHLATLRAGTDGDRNLFTDMGFAYTGPVDGHDVAAVERALRRARALRRPVLVHVVTVKGYGYPPAEKDEADCLHAVGAAVPAGAGGDSVSWTSVFGEALAELATARPEVVAITAAMLRPTGLARMAELFPQRVFDVGMAEQHAVTSAAGLAMGGAHPVVALYATFLNRAFDQVLMDVALHRLPVTFVLDRAGVTGPDGPSHHGMWDMSVLGVVPGLRLAAPRDAEQLVAQLREAVDDDEGPTVVRLPKANTGPSIGAEVRRGDVDILRRGGASADVLLAAVGPLAGAVLESARLLEDHGLSVTVVDPRWVLPVPGALVELAGQHRLVVSVEDGVVRGGFGWALADACRSAGVSAPVLPLGLPPAFLAHGSRGALLAECGLDASGITGAVIDAYDRLRPSLLRLPGGRSGGPASRS